MEKMIFKAYAITNEIDLNQIAVECGIPKKYTWEEPLVLQAKILEKILKKPLNEDQMVMVFSFGSTVFINFPTDNERLFIEYLKKFKSDININAYKSYVDDYELRIQKDIEMELTDQYVIVPSYLIYFPELISTVIAKSVALEKTEEQLGKILDKLENIIDKLDEGRLRISNKQIARTTAHIIRHEYNSIAYIMILDKPDITWRSLEAEEFYNKMSEFFELNDRYEILKTKTDILKHILEGFSSISQSIRGLFVEWVIVILIIFEVILMIADLIK